jgi:RNA polymerase subunit RPABC4/transcription elongation factor Spt4
MASKMRNCKSCGVEIAKSAKACPQCGARNKGLPTWATVLIVLAVVGGVITCGVVSCTGLFVKSVDEAVKETSKGSDITGPDGKVLTGDAAKKPTFPVGSQITVGDLTLKIDAPKNVKPGEFDSVKSGNAVVFHVTATNKGADSAYVSTSDFNLYVDGNKQEEVFPSGVDFSIEEINSNKTSQGDIAFDLKKGSTFELIYSPNFLTEQEITFQGKN